MTVRNPNQNERLAVLETQVLQLTKLVNEMDAKLDQLVELRARGVGAFWVASAIIGTGIVGSALSLWHWIRGTTL